MVKIIYQSMDERLSVNTGYTLYNTSLPNSPTHAKKNLESFHLMIEI